MVIKKSFIPLEASNQRLRPKCRRYFGLLTGFIVILIILFFGIFAFSVSAEEIAALTEEITASTTQATSTSLFEQQSEPAPSPLQEPSAPLEPEPVPPLPSPAEQPLSPPPLPEEPPPPTPPTVEPPAPAIDPAVAPSKVIIRVLMPDGIPPPFPVFVTFVGVGNKNFGGKINANGELTVIMPSGRYYTELMVISTEYVQGEDGPSFFLEANEERDFGAIRLKPKSEIISQSLEDGALEANILREAESTKGIGKILVLIVKLLIKILEEIRTIVQKL